MAVYFSDVAVKRGAETLLEKPSWGQAIKARRQALGLTQEDIEAITQDAISQKTVSDLEVGRVHPLKLGAEKFLALLSALRWTPEEFAQATGLDVPLVYRPRGNREKTWSGFLW